MTLPYDPVKAHQYYEQHKQLKGRRPAAAANTLKKVGGTRVNVTAKANAHHKQQAEARARAVRLTNKLHSLQKALKEATDALHKKRQAAQKSRAAAKKTAQKNSDGKTTAKEKAAAKKYRDTHKAQLAAKAKKAGGSSGGSTAKKSVSSMTEKELTTRISKIKSAISSAQKQLKAANALSHSQIVSDTDNHLSHDGAKGR